MSESQDTPSSSQVRGPSAESFLEVVERLGISDLPWMISLQHVDISLSPVQTESLLRQITSWEKEIQAWVNNPFKDNAKGANIIGVIETYSLLTALQLDSSLARNTCDALPQADGCIKIGGNSIDTIAKLYNWPAVIETALPALWQMVVDVKGQKVFTAPEQGHDDVGYLYSVFEKSKKTSKYSGMLSNLALAAAGLRSAMDGTEIPEKWGKEKAPNELKQFRDKNKYSGPQALLIPLHQALAVSPIMLLQRRDLMGKHVARHWHLLMWKHLGSPRPQLLVTVENAIWATVHQIALKPTKLHDVMEGLFNTLRTLANYDTGNGSVDFQVDQECRAFFRTLEPLFHTPTAPDRPTSPPPSRRASPAPPLPPQPTNRPTSPPPSRRASPAPPLPPQPTNRPTSPPPSRRASPAPPLPPQPTDRPVPPSRSTSVGDQDIVMHDDDKGVGSSKRKRSEDGDSSNESEDSVNGARFYKPKRLRRKGLHGDSDIDNESESGVDDAIPYKLKRLRRKVLDPLDDEDERHPRSQEPSHPKPSPRKPSHPKPSPRKPSHPKPSPRKPSHPKPSPAKPSPAKRTAKSKAQGKGTKHSGKPLAGPRNTGTKSAPLIRRVIGTSDAERYTPPSTILFDTRGEAVELLPSFHHAYARESFLALIRGIQRTCGESPPDYMSEDGNGMIKGVPFDIYRQWSASQVGELLKTKAILVTGVPVQVPGSFEDAIKGLNRFLDASVICNDQSIDLGPTGYERLTKVTLEELIAISKLPNCKALNCLDFPGPLPAGIPLVSDDSLDRVCYSATWSNQKPRQTADMSELTWTIAATPSCWHHIHVDANGFGTVAIPTFGRKLWALIRRKDDPSSSRPTDWQPNLADYDHAVLDNEDYEVSYAILEPGTALVMPGGTAHMVITLEDSTVFSGSHFYHGRSLRRHLFNFLFTGTMPTTTNTEHNLCAISIIGHVIEMIVKACITPSVVPDNLWHHLPQVSTTEGMKDVLVLCVVGRLLPVLHPGLAETHDNITTISANAIRLARQIQASKNYKFIDAADQALNFFEDIYKVYLQHVCKVLCSLLSLREERPPLDLILHLPECKGFDPVFSEDVEQPEGLSDARLDLAVERCVNFVLVE